MDRRNSEEDTFSYFPTLKQFSEDILDLVWQEEDAKISDILPNITICERRAASLIIAGFSQFWRGNFPFEEGTAFRDIRRASEKLGKEEAHWINTNEPLRRLKGRENQPQKLRSLIIHPKSGIVKVNVCQGQSGDILDLMDTDPIKLPALDEGDKLCHKCYKVGHVGKVCPNPRNKEAYKKKLKDDPVFGEKEKHRIRHNFKEYRRRKRQAAAKKRHCKSSHIRGLEGRSVG
ncbi:unnamed protein product [Allacma fusca]|uniref:CCHC-type domain-containing protein n=1 Tax=Allacma fusca TaxID=39272 RepID=A0A8J2PKK3_9HEXA|nr:unnamed protein product [Allacma fusca]